MNVTRRFSRSLLSLLAALGLHSHAADTAVYRIEAPTSDAARSVVKSLHDALLEGRWQERRLVLSLDAHTAQDLRSRGFSVQEDTDWQRRFEESRTQSRTRATNSTGIPGYACYATVDETHASMDALQAQYPHLARSIDIGDSWLKTRDSDGDDLRVLVLGNQDSGGSKPKLFVHSAMHAREYATAELNLRFARKLLAEYNVNADSTWILDLHEIHLLLQMNPDGRRKAETGLLWRKNVNNDFCSDRDTRGIDLNRNFSFTWNVVPNDGGSSSNACSSTFRGPSPASEPETQAVETYVRSLYADQRGPGDDDPAAQAVRGIHIDLHSYGELVLWPWGHTDAPAPNRLALQRLGRKFAFFNRHFPEQAIGLYPTDGTSEDVSYGELGVPAYTFEIGTQFFQDCASFENRIVPDNLKALKYAAKVVRAPFAWPAGPDIFRATVTMQNGSYQVTARASTTRYSRANGIQRSRTIVGARASIGTAPWQAGANVIAVTAADGAFDSKQEELRLTLDADAVGARQLVYLQAQDKGGYWGAPTAVFVGEP